MSIKDIKNTDWSLENIIGKTLMKVNYFYEVEGYDNYSSDLRADFEYLPIGGLHLKLSDGISYCIADYNTTRLEISGVGIKVIEGDHKDLTEAIIPERINEKWEKYLGEEIIELKLYINQELWTNNVHNELYPESLQLKFKNGESIYYFCGDVETFDHSSGQFKLLRGRDSGIIFFDGNTFNKYGLNKVHRTENYVFK